METMTTPLLPLFCCEYEFERLETPQSRINDQDNQEIFTGHKDGSDSNYHPSTWLQTIEYADYDFVSQERIEPCDTTPPETISLGQLYTLPRTVQYLQQPYSTPLESHSEEHFYQPTDRSTYLAEDIQFNQEDYPSFQREVENTLQQRRRELARRNAADQFQDHLYPLSITPSPSTSALLWDLSSEASQLAPTIAAVPGDLPKLETQVDAPFSQSRDQEERVIKRRYHKKKVLSEAEVIFRRDAFLTRNRKAADKCRTKRREWMKQLEDDMDAGRLRNVELKKEHLELMEEVRVLKGVVALCNADDQQFLKGQVAKEPMPDGDNMGNLGT